MYLTIFNLSFSHPTQAFLIIKGAVYAKKNKTINIDNTITIIPRVTMTFYRFLSYCITFSSSS